MNRSNLPPDDSLESDAVWKLIDQAAPLQASPSFVDDLVRMARLELGPPSFWKRIFSPAPLAGLAIAAAAIALAFTFSSRPQPLPLDGPSLAIVQSVDDSFAAIQEVAETETLLAAVDHLDDFSDQELASLIGF